MNECESPSRKVTVTQEINKLSSEPAVQVTPIKGRREDAKKYTNKHVDFLLNTVEEILPCGKMMWDNISLHCNTRDPDFLHNGESCKNKFYKMVFLKKPTSQVEILIQIRRVKQLKLKIDAEEAIGMVSGNEDDMDDYEVFGDSDVSSTRRSLVAANLYMGDSDEFRRPLKKKQREIYMVEAIERLTDVNRDSATVIEQAIIGMGDNNLETSVAILQGKFAVVERDTADIKMDISKIFSLLDTLNNKL